MDINIIIAIFGGLINMILSLIIPTLLKDSKQSFLSNINTIYTTNKQLIITSSLIVCLTIYIALSVEPNFHDLLPSWFTLSSQPEETTNIRFINLSNLSNNMSNNMSSCNRVNNSNEALLRQILLSESE